VTGARLSIVVIGLSLSSSWGNGHATTYRSLLSAFARRGHEILFLERDVPWYAAHRDLEPDFCRLEFYSDLADLAGWRNEVASADAVIVGSYVPDGVAVGHWARHEATGVLAFYDIDTPVTLGRLATGDAEYIAADQVRDYDLYLSFSGGHTLTLLEDRYGSPAARPLFCSVDSRRYVPREAPARWDLSYLGTYSADRQPTLERLLLEPARRSPDLTFCVAGPQYPDDIAWPGNVERIDHVAPPDHPAFYAASRFTLNITRRDMIAAGHSPSVRLFEAAACATPIISDIWEGLDELFQPNREILLTETADDVVGILRAGDDTGRRALGAACRDRILAAHTADHRAAELEAHLRDAIARLATERPVLTPTP